MNPKKALVVRGGWEGHSPIETTDLFIPFLRESGFEVQVEESPAPYADAALMTTIDLVLQIHTMSTITADELTGLRAAVASGTGLAGWHGGIVDTYRTSVDYLHLTGGQFATHAGCDPAEAKGDGTDNFVDYTVHLTPLGREHPITRGVADFQVKSELYWVLSDEYNDVLATVTQPAREWDTWNRPITFPAIWTRSWGKGKIFVTTPGHKVDDIEGEPMRGIIQRGLLWAAR